VSRPRREASTKSPQGCYLTNTSSYRRAEDCSAVPIRVFGNWGLIWGMGGLDSCQAPPYPISTGGTVCQLEDAPSVSSRPETASSRPTQHGIRSQTDAWRIARCTALLVRGNLLRCCRHNAALYLIRNPTRWTSVTDATPRWMACSVSPTSPCLFLSRIASISSAGTARSVPLTSEATCKQWAHDYRIEDRIR